MTTCAFDEAFEKVKSLAATFRADEKTYLDPSYKEASVRKDFIDKFFMALGWDVNHDIQTKPSAQEVSVERAEGASHPFFIRANDAHGDATGFR